MPTAKKQSSMENSTAEESDDELLLTSTKTHHKHSVSHHKHSVCALGELESDDELDLLQLSPRNKTRHTSRCACTSVDSCLLNRGPNVRKLHRHANRTQDMHCTRSSDPNADGEGAHAQDRCTDTEIIVHVLRPSKTRVTTVCPTGFLDLPHEVILLCLWDLPFGDIERCRTLNRQIYSLISGCAHMQYRAKQDRAGVEENHYAFQGQPWPIPERISKLCDQEKRWLEFRPTATYNFEVRNTGCPKVTPDFFLAPHMINGEQKAVKYIRTGTSLSGRDTFTLVDFTKPFVDFGAAIEEHDLIAAIHLYVLLHFFSVILLIYVLEDS
jgi:hypothetical protein